jgi:hypothetical protein
LTLSLSERKRERKRERQRKKEKERERKRKSEREKERERKNGQYGESGHLHLAVLILSCSYQITNKRRFHAVSVVPRVPEIAKRFKDFCHTPYIIDNFLPGAI